MKKKIIKILFMMAVIVCMFAAFGISSSAAMYEPDGSAVTQYEFDESECNRTIIVTCVDQSGKLLKKVNIETKRGEDDLCFVSLYNYRPIQFSSDQGLWETCKLMWTSGGSHFSGDVDIDYYFRTALSKETINVSTVWVPFDEITIREEHYKEYRVGTNGMTRNDVLAYSAPEKVIHCGDYFSTGAKMFTGWTLNGEYASGFSGYWSMSWIGDYKNINSLNDCCKWDVVDKTWESKDYPRWTKYNESEDGLLGHIENRIVTITYKNEVDWCVFSFDANGGTGAPTEMVAWWYDHEITIPDTVPTKPGATFLGWGTYSSDQSPDYRPGEKTVMGTTKTLYAIWSDYDFSVSGLNVSNSEPYKYDQITVSVRCDSWDQVNSYTNIPVQLYYDGRLVSTQNVDFSVYGIANITFTLNVGRSVGNKIIEARINWADHNSETRTENNTVSTSINVQDYDYEVSIDPVVFSDPYCEGRDVISSFYVRNDSDYDIIPEYHNTAQFVAYYYNGADRIVISTQDWADVVIPAGGTNLVYFKWRVPTGFSGRTVYLECTINADRQMNEDNYDNNTALLTTTVSHITESQTPDTRFESKAPNSYQNVSVPSVSTDKATWTVWEYENGGFVLKKYGVQLSSASPVVAPDSSCVTAIYENGKWTMHSGYGITMSYVPGISTVSGYDLPDSNAYTSVQYVIATFPEFRYYDTDGNCRTLQYVNGSYQFAENSDADGNARVHFIPVYVKDGNYTVSVTVTQIWTPAGMITAVRNSTPITVDGTVYDDFYLG